MGYRSSSWENDPKSGSSMKLRVARSDDLIQTDRIYRGRQRLNPLLENQKTMMRGLKKRLILLGSVSTLGLGAVNFGLFLKFGNIDPSTFVSVAIGSRPIREFSPSGDYFFETEVCRRKDTGPDAYLCVFLRIFSRSGNLLQEINKYASDVHQWNAQRRDDATIRMNSSDIGNYIYERQHDGSWGRLLPTALPPLPPPNSAAAAEPRL
jgi:hypothetical protein